MKFLLLQVRNSDDPMLHQEVRCFSRALGCDPSQIRVHDLLRGAPAITELKAVDIVLLGGSGDYSVAAGGQWLGEALMAMRDLFELAKPTFASCWGFQAMAKAMGGEVVTDLSRAEIGSIPVRLTDAGREDPLFAPLGDTFLAPMGHQDSVIGLPPTAVRLASSELVENQAFRFQGKPIYCTQFHPELDRRALIDRVRAYPSYVQQIGGQTMDEFIRGCREMPETDQLLRRFLKLVTG